MSCLQSSQCALWYGVCKKHPPDMLMKVTAGGRGFLNSVQGEAVKAVGDRTLENEWAARRRALSARRGRLVERAQHPLLSGEVHRVPPPVVVVGLEGEGGRLSIQIDQLDADVCPVRQLAHQFDEAG